MVAGREATGSTITTGCGKHMAPEQSTSWAGLNPSPGASPGTQPGTKYNPGGGQCRGPAPPDHGAGVPPPAMATAPRTGLVQASGQGGGSPAATSLDMQHPSRALRLCWHTMGTEEGPAAAMATARSPNSLSHPGQEKASRVTRVGFGTAWVSPATGSGAAWGQGPRLPAPRCGHSTEEGRAAVAVRK